MIHLLVPAALTGLIFALAPLLIHLLQRRQAQRATVPSVRFVPVVQHSSLRLRTPDDWPLLLLRTAVVVAAVIALAAPIVITPARQTVWNERTVRAVIVERGAGETPERDAERIASELESAYASVRIDVDSLADGLARGAAWLDEAPPGRRELVAVSEFMHGRLTAADIARLPADLGVRFVRRPRTRRPDVIDGGSEVLDGTSYSRAITLDGWRTSLTLSPTESAHDLRVEGTTPELAQRLQRVVRQAGAAPGHAGRTVIRFGERVDPATSTQPAPAAAAAAVRLAKAPEVGDVDFTTVADGDELIVTTSAAPQSFEAAVLAQAVVAAWRDPLAHAGEEVEPISDGILDGWSRPAPPAVESAWRYSERSDARWLWLVSLLCLGAEWWLRRRTNAREEAHVRAA